MMGEGGGNDRRDVGKNTQTHTDTQKGVKRIRVETRPKQEQIRRKTL